MATRYRVHNIHEEGQCAECGWPYFIGDYAYESRGNVFCSKGCAATFHERRMSREPVTKRSSSSTGRRSNVD